MTSEQLKQILDEMIVSLNGNTEQQDNVRLVKAYFTDEKFRNALSDLVWQKSQALVNEQNAKKFC